MSTFTLKYRTTLFWAIIILAIGIVIAFGLPYGPFDWIEKTWAQDVYNTVGSDLSNGLLPNQIRGFERLRTEGIVFGYEDSNDDGVADETDNLVFYQYDAQSNTFVPIELGDIGIADILAFEFKLDGRGVIAARLTDGTTAVYTFEPGTGLVQVQGLPQLNSPLVKLGSLFVVNNNDTNNPPSLHVVDPETHAITATRDLERSNTVVSFDPQAKYMLASTVASQLLRIYNLASADNAPLRFQYPGNLVSAPQWSPTGGKLFYAEQALNNRTESLIVIDATVGDKQTYVIPDYADNLKINGGWSSTGRYITLQAVQKDGALTDQPVTILDTTEKFVLGLEKSGTMYMPVSWSADDTYLLYMADALGSTSAPNLSLYNAVTLTSTPIDIAERKVLATAWHPGELKLALLVSQAGASADGYEVVVFDAQDNSLTSLSKLEILPFNAVSMVWFKDTELDLGMTFDELILENQYNVTFRIDTATGEKTELVPASVKLD